MLLALQEILSYPCSTLSI